MLQDRVIEIGSPASLLNIPTPWQQILIQFQQVFISNSYYNRLEFSRFWVHIRTKTRIRRTLSCFISGEARQQVAKSSDDFGLIGSRKSITRLQNGLYEDLIIHALKVKVPYIQYETDILLFKYVLTDLIDQNIFIEIWLN